MTPQNTWELTGTPQSGVPVALATACVRVGHDLTADTAVMAILGPTLWQLQYDELAPLGWAVVGLSTPSGTGFGTGIDITQDDSDLTVRVADTVQDYLAGYEFTTWPACPGHQHPMQPFADGHDAWWRCRADQRLITRIGRLGSDA